MAFESANDSTSFANVIRLMGNYEISKSIWANSTIFMTVIETNVNATFLEGNDFDLHSKTNEILDANQYGSAAETVRNIIEEEYFSFLEECNLSEIQDKLLSNLNIDEDRIAESFLNDYEYDIDRDDYEPGLRSSNEQPFDENGEIERLFDR